MKLTFIGATHEVTGSCFLIEAAGKKFLVDCGMEQGPNLYENVELPVSPGDLDFVLLTHAHIDHSGNLPKLYKDGFRGVVYATEATCDLCDIMLRDSAHIQMFEAEWRNRKGRRAGKEEFVPAYTMEDAMGVIRNFVACDYNQQIPLAEGITVRFVDAGHLLGSSSIEIWLTEEGEQRKLIFSGDIGNTNQPLIKDPTYLSEGADYVIMESTYGDRSHGERPEYVTALAQVIQRTFDRGGNLVIPSFAVGRTQEMLYFIRAIKERGLVHGHDDFPVYIDSPLAIEATGIFLQCDTTYVDEEMTALIRAGKNPIFFPGLHTAVSQAESKAINEDKTPKVIISASGMCDAGRIRHHLKHNLWRPECLVLFVGYQAVGTLGRALHDGAKSVKLFGEEINVQAEISWLPGVSGHADKDGLIAWLKGFSKKPDTVFVNHGDPDACESFTACLKNELGYNAFAPYSGTSFDLAEGEYIRITEGKPVSPEKKGYTERSSSPMYRELVAAAEALLAAVKKCEGRPNKLLRSYIDKIRNLSDYIKK